MTEQQKPFASMGYEPVPGLMNRLIARYLRTQRKNMKQFFEERGLYTLADRMSQIRKSRQGVMAKNLMFQKVLNEYSKLIAPAAPTVRQGSVEGVPASLEPAPVIAGETGEAENT